MSIAVHRPKSKTAMQQPISFNIGSIAVGDWCCHDLQRVGIATWGASEIEFSHHDLALCHVVLSQ